MYSLSVIHSLNNRPPSRKDHTNVDCGIHRTKAGIIIHSASLRSTLILVSPEAQAALTSWRGRKQRNRWIEAFFRNQCPEAANKAARHARNQ